MNLMRKILVIVVCFVCACMTDKTKVKEDLVPVLTKIILQDSVVVKLDSLLIDSVTSFTELEWAHEKIKRFNKLINLNNSFAEWSKKSIQSSVELAEIEIKGSKIENETMAVLLRDESYNTKKAEATLRTRMMIDEERKRLIDYQQEIAKYKQTIASLKKQISYQKLDSTNVRGYISYFRIIGSDSKGYEVSDTLSLHLSKDYNLIPIN